MSGVNYPDSEKIREGADGQCQHHYLSEGIIQSCDADAEYEWHYRYDDWDDGEWTIVSYCSEHIDLPE